MTVTMVTIDDLLIDYLELMTVKDLKATDSQPPVSRSMFVLS